MELRLEPDAAAVAAEVADRLLRACAAGRPLGLATGRTMEPVYGLLVRRWAALPEQQRAELRGRWRSFNLDDYVGLPPGDPRSFRAFMDLQLTGPLGLAADQVRLPDGAAADPQGEALRYAAGVAEAGGIGLQLPQPALLAIGRGFGHGVGMSQWGAYAMAQQGRSYQQILGHYYRGTELRPYAAP